MLARMNYFILPKNLPAKLKMLNASCNRLSKLPSKLPVELLELNISHNELSFLPDNFPAKLRKLDVSHNNLSKPVSMLPNGLLVVKH